MKGFTLRQDRTNHLYTDWVLDANQPHSLVVGYLLNYDRQAKQGAYFGLDVEGLPENTYEAISLAFGLRKISIPRGTELTIHSNSKWLVDMLNNLQQFDQYAHNDWKTKNGELDGKEYLTLIHKRINMLNLKVRAIYGSSSALYEQLTDLNEAEATQQGEKHE